MSHFIQQDHHSNDVLSSGFTLLETMLVLVLLSTLLTMLWSIVNLYSRSYLTTENRVSRSQLVRSLAQMMNDDLGSAIQDPIHPQLGGDSGEAAVRRFGIRGNASGLQIDVVQPNLFATAATPEENRQAVLGLGKSKSPQVPELKTIFYEFISPAVREKPEVPPGESTSSEITEDGMEVRAPSGSQLVGSLQTTDNPLDPAAQAALEPLVDTFGLSRRELDFETPFEKSGTTEGQSGNNADGSGFAGSLQTPTASELDSAMNQETIGKTTSPRLTPTQLTMSTKDATLWAPEVVDCRFEYYDGKKWLTDWDSIKKEGLPVAIRVTLKLMSIDEIETLRSSPEFLLWADKNSEPASS